MTPRHPLEILYERLFAFYGPQHWWPADEPFEVIIGAILTQSTSWINVEKAIANLKCEGVMTPAALRAMPMEVLARLIRPSGYYNVKARKVRAFVEHLGKRHNDSLESLFAPPIPELRAELLSIYGIGPETADSIILYAARKPIFVIDAYTHRIADRLGLNPDYGNYAVLQAFFMDHLPVDESLYNEYHALLVRHGKEVCRKSPRCEGCCLRDMCRGSGMFRTKGQ